jgi:hypothetical protein
MPEINQHKKRKGFFWLSVFGVSVYEKLASLLSSLWWVHTSWWKCVVEEAHSPYGDQEAKIRRKDGVPLSPSRNTPNYLLPLKFLPSPNSAMLRNKPLTYGPLEDIADQKYSISPVLHFCEPPAFLPDPITCSDWSFLTQQSSLESHPSCEY